MRDYGNLNQQSPQAPPAKSRNWPMIILGTVLGLCFLLCVVCGGGFFLMIYMVEQGPDTSVVSGTQMREEHLQTLYRLGLADEDDRILYFYSDALVDIEAGSYVLTDSHLALYNESWQQPRVILPFGDIATVTFDAATGDFIDFESTITVVTGDGTEYSFPVSNEQNGDTRFFQNLERNVNAAP